MSEQHTKAQLDLPVPELEKMARHLRRHVVSMIATAGSGHPGGSLSAADIVTALYFKVLRHNPQNPHWPDRDRFILSKGHAAPILYAVLAECGYFPIEELSTLRQLGSRLQGHTDRNLTPGVEMSAGSLGQGLSIGIGIALAGSLDKRDYHVYALLGDGECDEGQVWEAAMFAAHHKVDNLTAIIDYNAIQLDGRVCDIMGLEPLAEKWHAFNWHVLEIDGHNMNQILEALKKARDFKGKPTVIVAHTIKGKGVSFMENNVDFHGKAPSAQELETALKELE
ncbi:MAG: transketolase [Chloroflexi bacterium]|nr:transketolase [Chloroflexota bacterium]MBM3174915.1 transketolase [Chloroflexota bacterium]MBM4449694.1 transketolase [Chloroflexota bacterium]